MTGKMQQQNVIGSALCKQILNLRLDDVRWLVSDHLHGEAANLPVAEHSPKRLGVRPGASRLLSPSCSYSSLAMIRAFRCPLTMRSPP